MTRKILLSLLVALSLCPAQRSVADASTESAAQFLNQTVMWYRRVAAEREIASTPRDAVFVNDNARVGDQIVRLASDFARSEVQAGGKASEQWPGAISHTVALSVSHRNVSQAGRTNPAVAASRKIQDLDRDIQATNSLAQDCKQLQTALVAQLRRMAKQCRPLSA
ncbi:MAG: hypothetical protein WCA13_09310 [Terriglobales bacterium]